MESFVQPFATNGQLNGSIDPWQDVQLAGLEPSVSQADFEALARQEVGNPEVTIKADSAPVMRAWLPGTLRAVLDHAQPLELVGPIQQDERWILARINQITPAELDPSTRNRLSNQLFKRWLQSRLSGYSIRFSPTAPQA